MKLSRWLRKIPQPVAILADDRRVEVLRNPRGWKELQATIESLEPSKLTALDAQGSVLRSIVLDAGDEDERAAPSTATSPEMADLQLFARLLSEAYDKASSKMQPIVDSAMAFVERGGTRLAKAEADNDRLRAHIHKLNLQIADLSGSAAAPSDDDSLLSTIMAGAMQAASGGTLAALDGGKQPKVVKK